MSDRKGCGAAWFGSGESAKEGLAITQAALLKLDALDARLNERREKLAAFGLLVDDMKAMLETVGVSTTTST